MNHGDSGEDGKEEWIQEVRGLASSPSLGHPGNLRWIQWWRRQSWTNSKGQGVCQFPFIWTPWQLKILWIMEEVVKTAKEYEFERSGVLLVALHWDTLTHLKSYAKTDQSCQQIKSASILDSSIWRAVTVPAKTKTIMPTDKICTNQMAVSGPAITKPVMPAD